MELDKREGVSMLGYGKSNHMTRFLNTFPKFLYYRSDRGLISLSERIWVKHVCHNCLIRMNVN
jgi:hypothetical protein